MGKHGEREVSGRVRVALVPELAVRDIVRSLAFYRDLLGFVVRYERPEEGFALVASGAAELMLDQIDRGRTFRVEGAPLDHPLGRGVNFEITVPDVAPLLAAVGGAGVAPHLPPEERWYRTGDHETGVRQFAVPDPDGYLLRFSQPIGTRRTQRRAPPKRRPSAPPGPPDRG